MNLFITGASGFIGKNLLNNHKFLKRCKKIYCLSRKKNKSLNTKIEWIKGDLNSNLHKYFLKSDCLLHMASHSTNRPYDNLENCLKWNCKVPKKFISKAYKAGIKKFVILGTYHEYGMAGNIYKNKKTPVLSSLMPISTYAISKAIFFQNIFFWSINKKVGIRYLRLPHIYGIGEKKTRLWPKLKSKKIKKIIIFNPNFKTSFLSIEKLVLQLNNYINIKKIKVNFFEIINIVGKNMKLIEFAKIQKKKLSSKTILIKLKNGKNNWKYLIPKKDKALIKIK